MNANNLTEGGQAAEERATREAREEAWTERAKATVRNAAIATDDYVHEYTWSSIALVALTSGVIGFLLGSRRG